MIIHGSYNICSAWFLDIRVSTCLKVGGGGFRLLTPMHMRYEITLKTFCTHFYSNNERLAYVTCIENRQVCVTGVYGKVVYKKIVTNHFAWMIVLSQMIG